MAALLDLSTLVTNILFAAVIMAFTFVAVRIFRLIVRRVGRTVPKGLLVSIQQIGSWAIWIIGVIIALSQLEVNTLILLLVVGLGGLAVLLAYQEVLSDIASSQFISTYQPFKVGEWIEVQDRYGRVVETDLIHTKLLTPNNELVVIPNSSLLKQLIVNRTRSGSLRLEIPVFVGKGMDLMQAEKKLLEIGADMKVDLLEDSSPEVRAVEVGPDGAHLTLLLEVANPAKRDTIISDVQKKVYDLLRGKG